MSSEYRMVVETEESITQGVWFPLGDLDEAQKLTQFIKVLSESKWIAVQVDDEDVSSFMAIPVASIQEARIDFR